MRQRSGADGVVYSTEHGRMCPGCGQPANRCTCGGPAPPPVGGPGGVRLRLETKGRKGKGVTLIEGLPLAPLELAALGKELRTACGVGGTVKEGVIELQGDHRERVESALRRAGWPVKRVGG